MLPPLLYAASEELPWRDLLAVWRPVLVLAVGLVRLRITDPMLETVFALVTPYAAHVLGAALHVSPVTAVIVTGLVIGERRERTHPTR